MWYANLPEEVVWYQARMEGAWLGVALLLAFLHFFVPFFALVNRDAKGDVRRLRWVALLMLAAHWLVGFSGYQQKDRVCPAVRVEFAGLNEWFDEPDGKTTALREILANATELAIVGDGQA